MINFKDVLSKVISNQNWFTNMYYSWRYIDTTPYNRDEIVRTYINSAELRLTLSRILTSFVSIPIRWVDKNGKAIESSPFDDLLNNPNNLQTKSEMEYDWCLQYLLFNEVFIWGGTQGVALNKGKREFLKVLPGQFVDFKLKDGMISQYINKWNSNVALEIGDVMPCIGSVLNPDDTLHATSKVITASKILKKLEQGHEMDITAYGNKGANYLVSAKEAGAFDSVKARNMQESINNKNLKGGIRFTGAQVEVHDISRTPADLNILDTSKDSRKVLALLFDVPLPLVSDDASTYDNQKTAEEQLANEVTIPLKRLYCQKITRFLNDNNGNRLEVDIDRVKQIQRDPKEVQDILSAARASVNERRGAAGLPRLDGKEYDEPMFAINDQIGIAPDFNETDIGGKS